MNALTEYLQERGRVASLARGLVISHAAVRQWNGVCPAERVVDVERVTGIPREALRPDLYRREPRQAEQGAA